MNGMIMIIWICFMPLSGYFIYRAFMNKYGWGERTLAEPIEKWAIVFWAFFGPIGCVIVLLFDFRFCFMSKEESLKLYDKKDFGGYGYYVGRQIAKTEGRLPEGIEVGDV